MPTPQYTLAELRTTLTKSAINTIITEGKDDYSLFRGIQRRLGTGDCLPAGGKRSVLTLHDEAGSFSCPKIAFLVDSDLWTISGVPPRYALSPALICTEGYSIENDLLRDVSVESLIDDDHKAQYDDDFAQLIAWFSSGVTARLGGDDFSFQKKISQLIDPLSGILTPEARADIATWPPSDDVTATVGRDPTRYVRGKTWLGLICKYLDRQDRAIRHSPKTLLEIGLKGGGELSTRLLDRLRHLMT